MGDTSGRIVVSETVYHCLNGRQPTSMLNKFTRPVDSGEQPYTRVMKLTGEWAPVDVGWLSQPGQAVGHVVVKNETDKGLPPVELGMAAPGGGAADVVAVALVRPGESCRFEPADVSRLRIRTQAGSGSAVVVSYGA